jgi:hypothetical protein
MKPTVFAASLALAALVTTSPVSRADEVDVPDSAASALAPIEPSAAQAAIPKGTRTVYIFNGARHFDLTQAFGALTATTCTHLGLLPINTTTVPILVEFYSGSGSLAGSATGNISASNASTTVCTGTNATSRRVGCGPSMGLTGTVPVEGFIRVVVPNKNASRILCTAELAAGVDGGGANIVDRLIGVRRGALVFPPDTFIP